jgi:hypothetical protein
MMARLGPLYTLAAGGVVAVVLGVLTVTSNTGAQVAAPVVEVTSSASAPASPPPSPPPPAQPVADPSAAPEPTDTVRPTPKRADYAGRVDGNRGLIAISIRDGKAIGYFCDGKIEAWFKGTAENGEINMEGFNRSTITATLGGGKAKGEIKLGNKTFTFTAPLVKKPSGLYRASALVRGAQLRGGWIVLPDGTQVGTAFADGQQVPTPRLTPGENVSINGIEVDPQDVDEFIEEF